MRRTGTVPAFSAIALSALTGCVSPGLSASCEQGAEAALNDIFDYRAITVGEMHGTNEMPAAFASLVLQAAESGERTVVALEFPTDRQDMLDQFVKAHDKRAANAILTEYTSNDGRTSPAMRAMLQKMRDGIKGGANIQLVAVDRLKGQKSGFSDTDLAKFGENLSLSLSERDIIMGRNAVAACEAVDCEKLFYFAGNIHSRLLVTEMGYLDHETGAMVTGQGTPAGVLIADAMPTTAIYLPIAEVR